MEKITLNELRDIIRKIMGKEKEQQSMSSKTELSNLEDELTNKEEQPKNEKLRIRRLVGGLTINELKYKHPWVFNADIENAVIGLDGDYLVWYSGIWHDGAWKGGKWLKGTFAGGTWEKGDFWRGTFVGGTWKIGRFFGGTFAGGTWKDGDFYGGTFDGGTWENGLWDQGSSYRHSFAANDLKISQEDNLIWKSGKWKEGKIYYRNKNNLIGSERIFVDPNEYFKGDDEAEYNIEQHGSYFIVVYKNYKGEENERAFKTREAAENFAKNL
jgi:hypothetical protein